MRLTFWKTLDPVAAPRVERLQVDQMSKAFGHQISKIRNKENRHATYVSHSQGGTESRNSSPCWGPWGWPEARSLWTSKMRQQNDSEWRDTLSGSDRNCIGMPRLERLSEVRDRRSPKPLDIKNEKIKWFRMTWLTIWERAQAPARPQAELLQAGEISEAFGHRTLPI